MWCQDRALLHLYCNDLRPFLHHCCQRRTSTTRGQQKRDFQLLLFFKFRCRCNLLRPVKDMTQKYPESLEPSSKRQERASCLHCSAAEHWGGRRGCGQAMCLVGLSGSLQVDQRKLSLLGNVAPVRRTAVSQEGNNNRRLLSSQHESHLSEWYANASMTVIMAATQWVEAITYVVGMHTSEWSHNWTGGQELEWHTLENGLICPGFA